MEAIKQITAEAPGVDGGLQVPVGGGDHPDVDADGTIAADTLKLVFLQNTQEGNLTTLFYKMKRLGVAPPADRWQD
jgi:hypothetical protein